VIIGIDEYLSEEVSKLKYAVNNANMMESALRATGFQTIVLLNNVNKCFYCYSFEGCYQRGNRGDFGRYPKMESVYK
jgi:hypothetical protein